MRFHFPMFPGEFKIPDEWWRAAGMVDFKPVGQAYRSEKAVEIIPLRQIEPPFRSPERPIDYQGFCRKRLERILAGFVAGVDIEPVWLFTLPQLESWEPSPFRYRVRDGFHRFYASVAASFECLPAKYTESVCSAAATDLVDH